MEWLEILQRIAAGETEQTEFKRGAGDLSPVGRAICAFANTQGGVVLLGVEDTGEIVGVVENAEKVQERLTGFLQSGLSSPVTARTARCQDPKGWVHWVEVPRQRGFEPLGFEDRVWVRRGRSSVEPSPLELQDLYNTFGYIVTEERRIEAAGMRDIDLDAFRAYLNVLGLGTDEPPQPTEEQDLVNRGVLVGLGAEARGTVYGVLAFGKDPQRFPQTRSFWIDCVAYAGTDRSAPAILTGEAKGRLDEQVERAVGWLRTFGRFEQYRALFREEQELLPTVVLREALVNAVAHRDYAILGSKVLLEVFSDRIVVTSPGALPNTITPESVRAGGHPRSRNESMANFLLVRRLMEQRGRGWPIMLRRLREFNGAEPMLEVDTRARSVRVTLPLQRLPSA